MKKEKDKKYILKQLPKKKTKGLTLEEIQDELEKIEKKDLSYENLKKEINDLIKQGHVESFIDEKEIKKYFFVKKKNKKKHSKKKFVLKPIKNIKKKILCILFLGLSAYLIIHNRFSDSILALGKIGINTLPFSILFFIIGIIFFLISYKKKK